MSHSIEQKPKSINKILTYLLWAFVLFFGIQYLIIDALHYLGLNESIYGRFWDVKWVLFGHVGGGLLALTLGATQFWSAFRSKYIKWHRLLGKIYLVSILIGAISSFLLAGSTAIQISFAWAASLVFLGIAWLVTSGMAYWSIIKKRINQHKEWMIRSYIVTFAFASFRSLMDLPIVENLGSFPEVAPTMIWISWAVPLLIAEVLIQAKRN